MNVPQNAAGKRLLLRCFKLVELDYLDEQPEFQRGVADMQSLQDFENVVAIGHRLLLERDDIRPPA